MQGNRVKTREASETKAEYTKIEILLNQKSIQVSKYRSDGGTVLGPSSQMFSIVLDGFRKNRKWRSVWRLLE